MTTSATNATATAQQPSNGAAGAAAAVCNGNVNTNAIQLNHQQATVISTTTTTTVAPLQPQPQSPLHQTSLIALTGGQAGQNPRVMQSDEDFNIRFVNLVRIHKCLYDKKVPEYRNRDNQEKAWSLISQETRESVIHCKERWRNLRACLSRYIKQQNSSDPQHKPYYLTEHMAFLLPFLKSTRNSVDNGHGMAALFQITQPHHHQHTISPNSTIQVIQPSHLHYPTSSSSPDRLAMKHSLSEQEDEETIDAFDPAIAACLQAHNANNNNNNNNKNNNNQNHTNHNGFGLMQHHLNHLNLQAANGHSPPLSDTASANTMQNFIPDVQLSELRTPEPQHPPTHGGDLVYSNSTDPAAVDHLNGSPHDSSASKRIKTECNSQRDSQTPAHMSAMYAVENSDMEFFRSILPDIGSLTPQQKRKLKIGILELIDDVVERYPAERLNGAIPVTNNGRRLSGGGGVSVSGGKQRRTLSRDWRK